MDPRYTSSPDGQDSNDIITAEDVERIANPLSVVHGYTQLLQRRLRRGQTIDDAELDRVLNLVEESSRSVGVGLAALIAKLRSHGEGSTPE